MNRRLYPITALTVVLALVAVFGYMAGTESQGTPMRVLLDNMAGPVIFDHALHAEGYGIECSRCHHETDDPLGDGVIPCAECHNEDNAGDGMPGTMDAFHLQCMGCHADFGGPYEPDQCNQCHFK